jgi:hypothetical protein
MVLQRGQTGQLLSALAANLLHHFIGAGTGIIAVNVDHAFGFEAIHNSYVVDGFFKIKLLHQANPAFDDNFVFWIVRKVDASATIDF